MGDGIEIKPGLFTTVNRQYLQNQAKIEEKKGNKQAAEILHSLADTFVLADFDGNGELSKGELKALAQKDTEPGISKRDIRYSGKPNDIRTVLDDFLFLADKFDVKTYSPKIHDYYYYDAEEKNGKDGIIYGQMNFPKKKGGDTTGFREENGDVRNSEKIPHALHATGDFGKNPNQAVYPYAVFDFLFSFMSDGLKEDSTKTNAFNIVEAREKLKVLSDNELRQKFELGLKKHIESHEVVIKKGDEYPTAKSYPQRVKDLKDFAKQFGIKVE